MRLRTVVLVLVSLLLAGEGVFSQSKFDQLENQLQELSNSERQAEAVALLDSVGSTFAENQFDVSNWYGQLYFELQQFDKAFDVWETGHAKGYFYMLHPRMPMFKPVAEMERFKELSEVDMAMRAKANEISRSISEIVLPDNYDSSRQYPLLIALHGGGRELEQVKQHWQSERLSTEFIVMYVQSYRHYNLKRFGWSSGDQRAQDDIRRLFDDVVARYSVDTSRVIIGGISAGGVMAIDIALAGIIPLVGFYGVCPAQPRSFDAELVNGIKARGLKGYIIAGDTDFYHDSQVTMTALFDEIGFPYEYHIIEGLGHDYPDDFSEWIDRGLEFLD